MLFRSARCAGARGKNSIHGSPKKVADYMEEWFVKGACDGFNVMPAWLPGSLTDFVDLVKKLDFRIVEVQDVDDKVGNGFTAGVNQGPLIDDAYHSDVPVYVETLERLRALPVSIVHMHHRRSPTRRARAWARPMRTSRRFGPCLLRRPA